MPDEKKERLKPVVGKEDLVETKKSFAKKLKNTFLPTDGTSVKDYVIYDILIPGAQNAVLDVLEMMFFDSVSSRGRSRRGNGYTDYSSSYKGKTKRRRDSDRRDRDREDDRETDYRDIVLKNRDDAEEVIDQLMFRIKETGAATVADLLDLVELPTKPSQNDWGWDRSSDISLRRVSSGWLIDVARARYLD